MAGRDKTGKLTAIAVYSDMDTSFEFASSDNMLNQIVKIHSGV